MNIADIPQPIVGAIAMLVYLAAIGWALFWGEGKDSGR